MITICERDSDEDMKTSVCFNPVLSSFPIVYCTLHANEMTLLLRIVFFVSVIITVRVKKSGKIHPSRKSQITVKVLHRRSTHGAVLTASTFLE